MAPMQSLGLLGHVNEALEGGGHPGPLPLHKHHAPVYVHCDAAKCVQLLALVPPAHQGHEDYAVLHSLGLDQVLEVGGGGHDPDASLGYALRLLPLLRGSVLEVPPALSVCEIGNVFPRPRLHVVTCGRRREETI